MSYLLRRHPCNRCIGIGLDVPIHLLVPAFLHHSHFCARESFHLAGCQHSVALNISKSTGLYITLFLLFELGVFRLLELLLLMLLWPHSAVVIVRAHDESTRRSDGLLIVVLVSVIAVLVVCYVPFVVCVVLLLPMWSSACFAFGVYRLFTL
jgi:uncharacterized membrane protein YhaH (DUF805 family)